MIRSSVGNRTPYICVNSYLGHQKKNRQVRVPMCNDYLSKIIIHWMTATSRGIRGLEKKQQNLQFVVLTIFEILDKYYLYCLYFWFMFDPHFPAKLNIVHATGCQCKQGCIFIFTNSFVCQALENNGVSKICNITNFYECI